MRRALSYQISLIAAAILLAAQFALGGQLEVKTNDEPQKVFCGEDRKIGVTFHNPRTQPFEKNLRARVFQTSATTAVFLYEKPWKRVTVPPGGTLIEAAQISFPPVKAETRFVVQWLVDSSVALGSTEALVYPPNMLLELKTLAGVDGPGVLDPCNIIKPLLRNLKIDFIDLERRGLENFAGRLAILGPFDTDAQMREHLRSQIEHLKKNTAIVWIAPHSKSECALPPSYYSVAEPQGAVVVVQPGLVSNFAENPQSQINLIFFSRLALHPRPLALPDLSTTSNLQDL